MNLKPSEEDEWKLQLFALQKIKNLHNQEFQSHYNFVSDEKLKANVSEQLIKTYTNKNPHRTVSSNHGLSSPDNLDELLIDENIAYEQAKSFYILNKIINTTNKVYKNIKQ